MVESTHAAARHLVSLDHAPVTDVHCHGWRLDDVLSRPEAGFLGRSTMLGMCLMSSGADAAATDPLLERLTASTPMALALARRLAGPLNCSPDAASVSATRAFRLGDDASGYLQGLWLDAGLTGALVDDGYPLPQVDQAELHRSSGLPIHRVSRLEPIVDDEREAAGSFAELCDAVRSRLEAAVGDGAVAFKSVIAYRTGLDVAATNIGVDEEAAFRAWRASGWIESRETSKPIRDATLRLLLDVAAANDRPVHIHCGGGDPDVVLAHARPQDLFGLLSTFRQQPVVLIHAGWPWTEEAAYVASVLPQVYLDVSVMVPWASLAIDQKLEVLLGAAPAGKVLYGSDEASEPEVLWFAAHVARGALERVLSRAVEHDWLTIAEATRIGEGVLAGNARALHGLA